MVGKIYKDELDLENYIRADLYGVTDDSRYVYLLQGNLFISVECGCRFLPSYGGIIYDVRHCNQVELCNLSCIIYPKLRREIVHFN
jgi:hypothetical protein